MDGVESIYELVPQPVVPNPRNAMYHSKHPGKLPPTFSTFGLAGTSKPGVSNVGGANIVASGHHTYKKPHATFGTEGNARIPSQILKKSTGGGGGAVAAELGVLPATVQQCHLCSLRFGARTQQRPARAAVSQALCISECDPCANSLRRRRKVCLRRRRQEADCTNCCRMHKGQGGDAEIGDQGLRDRERGGEHPLAAAASRRGRRLDEEAELWQGVDCSCCPLLDELFDDWLQSSLLAASSHVCVLSADLAACSNAYGTVSVLHPFCGGELTLNAPLLVCSGAVIFAEDQE